MSSQTLTHSNLEKELQQAIDECCKKQQVIASLSQELQDSFVRDGHSLVSGKAGGGKESVDGKHVDGTSWFISPARSPYIFGDRISG